jgi:transposase
MMGPQQQREPTLFHYGVNLDKRVRSSNPLRAMKQAIDFSFVRPRVAGFYGIEGHESEDPIVIMKLMLLLFMDDISSERELMRIVPERLDYLWFLDFDLDDEIPNHSVLSKARKRWGIEVFEELFVGTVSQCVRAGLVDGNKIHMDGSLVDANASKESIRTGPPELIEQLRKAFRGEVEKFEELGDEDDPQGKQQKKHRTTVSSTDPDAAVARKGGMDGARPRYKNHRAVDNQCGVITAVETTPGDVTENHRLMDLVRQHETNTGEKVTAVVADSQYGTNENFLACRERQIRSHMKDLRSTQINSATTRGIFKEAEFVFDEETKTYRCPAGEQLKWSTKDRHYDVFRSQANVCRQCPLRDKCIRSKHGVRTIKRHRAHEQIQQARTESHSADARRDRRRRKHLMEGSFADAANNHGFKRARWRRLENQRIQDLLIASCQNVRIFLSTERPRQVMAMIVKQLHTNNAWADSGASRRIALGSTTTTR